MFFKKSTPAVNEVHANRFLGSRNGARLCLKKPRLPSMKSTAVDCQAREIEIGRV